ncbi:hypothetical protein C9374_011091 [Naegleria lovaniensis]|uniref:Cytochrome P450 n=1 Tax=Naegleria lovaniensis TaxID=51637 RepID=A0AA88KF51_NAELO|nr:uncharacterized protein C9374_011091 [Naegleria lovaniensis]KAG2374254.1 hypothetical protein C9374_011091 [Naegleria lovaniensis]
MNLIAIIGLAILTLLLLLYLVMRNYEAKVIGKVQVVGLKTNTHHPSHHETQEDHHAEERELNGGGVLRPTHHDDDHNDTHQPLLLKKKKITFQTPDPVPVSELAHYNALWCLLVNIFRYNQASVQTYERAFALQHFRPHFGFVGKIPVVIFATPSAARVFVTKWKEVAKDNTLVFTEDMHKFFGVNVVFSNGDEWKRQRKVLDPSFYNIERFTQTFVENAQKTMSLLNKLFQDKGIQEIEISPSDVTARMALDVLGLTIFGEDFDYLSQLVPNHKSASNESNKKALDAYHYVMNNIGNAARLFIGKPYTSLPLESNVKMDESIEVFQRFLDSIIEKCRKQKDDKNTLLHSMIEAVDDEGHETTASALAFLFYSLAKNPQVQEKLYEEIVSTFSSGEDISNYNKLQNMTYLDCVLKENMRLYPPISQLPPRILTSSQVIDGYKIPKDFLAILNIYALHRHPDVWGKDAEEFKPERFLENSYPPFSYLPFSLDQECAWANNFH